MLSSKGNVVSGARIEPCCEPAECSRASVLRVSVCAKQKDSQYMSQGISSLQRPVSFAQLLFAGVSSS
jgi:hypothetical protein